MSARQLRQLTCACLLTACASTNSSSSVFVAANILPSVAHREKEWTRQRTTLALSAGRASDCAAYTRLRPSGVVEDGANQRIKSEYLICDVLDRLERAPTVKILPINNYGAVLATRLDLRSFRSSLGPMVDERHYTLSRLFKGQVRIQNQGAVVETPDMLFSLTIVLVGDVDHNGSSDWLVWLSDEVLAGTYRRYETLLIKDVAAEGFLQAQSL
jgi:hypothetical protein